MSKKNMEGIVKSVGPETTGIVVLFLKACEEKNIDTLIPILEELKDEGWRREAQDFAKMHAQVKENTEQMKRNEHPTNFVADGGLIFYKDNNTCPHCDGTVVSSKFCSQIKEAHVDLPYGGVIMCTNNILVKAQTDGTGECEYEAWLPEHRSD